MSVIFEIPAAFIQAKGVPTTAEDLGYGARGLVLGLGHDQLQRDLLVAEVGCCELGVAALGPDGGAALLAAGTVNGGGGHELPGHRRVGVLLPA